MITLYLKRVATNEDGTYGVLIEGFVPFALTLEESWKDNEANESCIPNGDYLCKKITSPKYGITFQVMGVPNRSHILFHWGNTEKDTKGCILVGEQFGYLYAYDDDTNLEEKQPAVISSKVGFQEFMDRLGNVNEFNLVIRWV